MNADATAAAPSGSRAGGSSLWPGLLASTAAFSAYLALLGGGLLAIRFSHAGLPVVPAVSAVPLSTLITTALIELLPQALALTFLGVGFGASRFLQRQESEEQLGLKRAIAFVLIFAFGACFLPLNLYGLAFAFSISVPFVLAEWLLPPTALEERRVMLGAVTVLAITASLPVLVRQAIEPINMERVRIEQRGQPALVADLVAIRDSSIVVARCHHLYVLPIPSSMRVEKLPSVLGVGTSVAEKLGIGSLGIVPDTVVRSAPMPC